MPILKRTPPRHPVAFTWPATGAYLLTDAEPKPGFEAQYERACRHRATWMGLYDRTPWWQHRKRARRLKGWLRAIEAVHRFGQDVVGRPTQKYEQHDWGKQ